MTGLVVIFRTQSEVEASIVRGLLEAHDLPSILSSSATASRFPVNVNEMGEVRISVHEGDAEEARRIIESHRTEASTDRVVRLRDEFETLQRDIEYRFRDRGLLEQAMTHASRANEDVSGGVRDNESLEFLGDAVLGFIIADLLFREFPAFNEGQKSKMKAALVSTTTLARQAERLALGDHLLLGRGEERSGGRQKQALLADGYEALIAAIYLDGGVEHVRAFLAREFAPLVAEVRRQSSQGSQGSEGSRGSQGAEPGLLAQDYKSRLQEQLQARDEPLPEYRLAGTMGPDHEKVFRVGVFVRGEAIAEGMGGSKKEAEQEAARIALEKLGSQK
jgi:ribonuclease-3